VLKVLMHAKKLHPDQQCDHAHHSTTEDQHQRPHNPSEVHGPVFPVLRYNSLTSTSKTLITEHVPIDMKKRWGGGG
jgi:hypothetical protein